MTRAIKCILIALAFFTAGRVADAAQKQTEISFAIAHVQDRYALNFPVIRDLFRLLDIGYAGCSVELTVTRTGAKIPFDANSRIQVHYTVQLNSNTSTYSDRINGSIARQSVPIYLKNKCADISKIKIGEVVCFTGFKNQWIDLTCPYDFQAAEFSIPDYFAKDQ